MEQKLTQCEVEWLRCLTISKKLTPVLPEDVRRKLERARLVEARSGQSMLTKSGNELLRRATHTQHLP